MHVVCFANLVYTGLWAIWAEQHALYTRFLHRLARKESNVQKRARCPNIYTVTLGSGNDNDNGNEILFLFTAAD